MHRPFLYVPSSGVAKIYFLCFQLNCIHEFLLDFPLPQRYISSFLSIRRGAYAMRAVDYGLIGLRIAGI